MDFATRRGFSLIELLAALTLAGIVASLAFPGWNRLLPTHNLHSAVRVVQSDLQSIKMRAAAESVSYRFVYQTNAPEYSIEKNGSPLLTKALPQGVSITQAGAISFSPRGTASGNRVRLRSWDDACQQVVVSPTGRVRACKPSVCTVEC
jgi:prepilin-type N-terminal cleavage/methylation domain-containing protein